MVSSSAAFKFSEPVEPILRDEVRVRIRIRVMARG